MPSDTHAFYDSLICEDESQGTFNEKLKERRKNSMKHITTDVNSKIVLSFFILILTFLLVNIILREVQEAKLLCFNFFYFTVNCFILFLYFIMSIFNSSFFTRGVF